MKNETYTLRELNEFIRRIIALNFSSPVWVTSEINQVGRSKGHYYLTLIQKNEESGIVAQSDAVLWAGTALKIRTKLNTLPANILQEGMAVRLRVRPTFHEKYGLKLTIEDIDLSFTLGNLEQKRQAILEQLQAEGLIRKNKGQPFPVLAQRIAVISAKTAAGYGDFQQQLYNNTYGYQYRIRLFESTMQGVAVEKEMTAALKSIRNLKDQFDVVVIIRGGGAKIDLAAFDNYEIAKMAANFPLPIITGIGHEMNQSLLDMVVHTSLKTPTAVAQFLIEYHLGQESAVLELGQQIQVLSRGIIDQRKFDVQYLRQAINLQAQHQITQVKEQLKIQRKNLPYFANKILNNAKKDLNTSIALQRLLDKDNILKRGYSLTLKGGDVVTNAAQVGENDELITVVAAGEIRSVVLK